MRSATYNYRNGAVFGFAAVSIWASWSAITRLAVTTSLNAWDIAALRFGVAGFLLCPVLLRRGLARDRLGWLGLAVEPQHVVLGQTQSADGGAGFEATMRAVPVIAMQPDWEFGGTLIGIQIRAGIRPLA